MSSKTILASRKPHRRFKSFWFIHQSTFFISLNLLIDENNFQRFREALCDASLNSADFWFNGRRIINKVWRSWVFYVMRHYLFMFDFVTETKQSEDSIMGQIPSMTHAQHKWLQCFCNIFLRLRLHENSPERDFAGCNAAAHLGMIFRLQPIKTSNFQAISFDCIFLFFCLRCFLLLFFVYVRVGWLKCGTKKEC